MRIRRNRPPKPNRITFSVGAPPTGPRPAQRRRRPSLWPTAALGTLVVCTLIILAMSGHQSDGTNGPTSVTTTATQPSIP